MDCVIDGFLHGQAWARDGGEAHVLRRLHRYHAWLRTQPDGWSKFFQTDRVQDARELLAIEILDDDLAATGPDEIRAFWQHAIGDADEGLLEDGQWLRGFAEGALSL